MKRLWLTLIIGFSLIFPASAGAVTWDEQYELANRYWEGPPPLCATVTIVGFSEGEDMESLGYATIPVRPGTKCLIMMREDLNAYGACYVMMHEVGHLHGHEHSDDPESIMHSPISTREATIGLCERQWRVLKQEWRERHGR